MESIFEGIVRDENDHTRLLANLAERQPSIKAGLLKLFSAGKVTVSDPLSLAIDTQWVHTDKDQTKSIPDLRIRGEGVTCLLEVKVQDSLPLSQLQKEAYHKCFAVTDEKHFCLLVRSTQKYEHEFSSIGDFASQNKIHFHHLSWNQLLIFLDKLVQPLEDDVATEIVSFLQRRFELVKWTPEERKQVDDWSNDKFLAIRKLEKVIEQVKAIAEAKGYKTEGEYFDPNSHGFYIRLDKEYPIWIGAWSEAKTPISLAVNTEPGSRAGSALSVDGVESTMISKDRKWRIYPLRGVDWSNPERLWEDIERLFPNLLNAVL